MKGSAPTHALKTAAGGLVGNPNAAPAAATAGAGAATHDSALEPQEAATALRLLQQRIKLPGRVPGAAAAATPPSSSSAAAASGYDGALNPHEAATASLTTYEAATASKRLQQAMAVPGGRVDQQRQSQRCIQMWRAVNKTAPTCLAYLLSCVVVQV